MPEFPDPSSAEGSLGERVAFQGARMPAGEHLSGSYVTVRPLDPAGDGAALFAASHSPNADPAALWRYMWEGPYSDLETYVQDLAAFVAPEDRRYFALVPHDTGTPAGQAAYMRITPGHGVIEVGHIWLGAQLQRTAAATEAIFLMAQHVFDDLGYRRLEWKCDALNARSRRAAARFGFEYEGTFAQHMVVKGRNRDTAWFAITDRGWPTVRAGFDAWLAPENFDDAGGQVRTLEQCRAAVARS